MGMIEDVMKALERIPLWKRLARMPEQLEQLQARVNDLETKLSGASGPPCLVYQAPGFRRTESKPDPTMGDLGIIQDTFQCPACHYSEARMRDTLQQ